MSAALFIGGLSDDVTADNLRAAFLPFGEVKSVDIPRKDEKGKSRGFAFVQFEEVEDAEAAQDNMNNATLYGRTISVGAANPKSLMRTKAMWDDDSFFKSLREDGSGVRHEVDITAQEQKKGEEGIKRTEG
jgi:peptidyl-prolyl isomerase E (cyclophilin E)